MALLKCVCSLCSEPDASGPERRAKCALATLRSRLAGSQELDKFMPALKEMCLYHFVAEGKLVGNHFPCCEHMNALPSASSYHSFRMAFKFRKYAYCYVCGMPQDKKQNRGGPSCHVRHDFEKKKPCEFSSFIFCLMFYLWQLPEWGSKMAACLGLGKMVCIQQQFTEWVVTEEVNEGKYHNCLKAFLWFCRRKQGEDPSFFL